MGVSEEVRRFVIMFRVHLSRKISLYLAISTLLFPSFTLAAPSFSYVGEPMTDCNLTSPSVYPSLAVEGQELEFTVIGHPSQPGQPGHSHEYQGQQFLLFLALVDEGTIVPEGIPVINLDMKLYHTLVAQSLSIPLTADENGTATYSLNLPAGSDGKQIFAQAFAIAPYESRPDKPSRSCTTNKFSHSRGIVSNIRKSGLRAQTNTTMQNSVEVGGMTAYFDGYYPVGTGADGRRKYVVSDNGVRVVGFSHPSSNHDASSQVIATRQSGGGTFRLTFNGQTTGPISAYAEGSEVREALLQLNNIQDVDVRHDHISANYFARWVVEFYSTSSAPTTMTIDYSNLTPEFYYHQPKGFVQNSVRHGGTYNFSDGALHNTFSNAEPNPHYDNLGFNSAGNMAADISESNPLVIPTGETYIGCRSYDAALGNSIGLTNRPLCEDGGMFYLNVSPAEYEEDDFLPSYAGNARYVLSASNLDLSYFRNLPDLPSHTPLYSEVLDFASADMLLIAHGGNSYRGLTFNYGLSYGRDYSSEAIGKGMLWLHLNKPLWQKQNVAKILIQNAIEMSGISLTNRSQIVDQWSGNYQDGLEQYGGHQQGGYMISIGGAMAGDPQMAESHLNGRSYGEKGIYLTVTQEHINNQGFPQSMLGQPGYTITPGANYSQTSYQDCCSMNAFASSVLAIRLMGQEVMNLLDNPAVFTYADFYLEERHPKDPSGQLNWLRFWDPFGEVFYDSYRSLASN